MVSKDQRDPIYIRSATKSKETSHDSPKSKECNVYIFWVTLFKQFH